MFTGGKQRLTFVRYCNKIKKIVLRGVCVCVYVCDVRSCLRVCAFVCACVVPIKEVCASYSQSRPRLIWCLLKVCDWVPLGQAASLAAVSTRRGT